MILTVGSTGFLGTEICRRLAAAGKPVRAMVRVTSDPAKVERLKSFGAQIVYGDLKDPASLAKACQGVTAVLLTASTTISRQPDDSIAKVNHQGSLDLIEAAEQAGVRHFVYISGSGNYTDMTPLLTAMRAVEGRLRSGKMTYTILRGSSFTEIWLTPMLGFDYIQGKATLFGDGHQKLSFISLGDVAQFMIDSLDNPAARNATFEIGGPQALSFLEVVRIFEQVGGKHFELQFVPLAALRAQRGSATDPYDISMAGFGVEIALHGDVIDISPALKAFSITLSSVEGYARRVLGS